MSNLKLTLRGLARSPLFTVTAILSLAVGIGANTSIFSIVDQIMLRLLPIKNPQELVFLYHPGPVQGRVSNDEGGGPVFSYPMFREMQNLQTAFAGLAGARGEGVSLSYKNQPLNGEAHMISGNYFELLGVEAAMGRLLNLADDSMEDPHPVAVLSHTFWQRQFGADRSMLNQTILVNGYPLTIVGVSQKSFRSEKSSSTPDIYIPVTMKRLLNPDYKGLENRKDYWFTLIARLKPEYALEKSEAAINTVYRGQLEIDEKLLNKPSDSFLQRFRAKRIILKPGEHGRGGIREQGKQPLFLLMGITALVLLLACANVANLLLARAAARTREVALRLALGASRSQIIRQLLLESFLLAVGGAVLGLVVAHWTTRVILSEIPASAGVSDQISAALDPRVLLYCLGLALATVFLFGLFPALSSTKPDLAPSLKDQAGQTTATGSANFFRKALVTTQVAVSLLLLISAGLFAKTLVNLNHVDLGVKIDNLMTFSLNPKLNKYSDERTLLLYKQLNEKLAAIPGVIQVSSARVPVIAGSSSSQNISVQGYVAQNEDDEDSSYNETGADYFRTLGLPLISGREFTAQDIAATPKVAVVNEAFAKHFFGGQNPIGRRFDRGKSGTPKYEIEIVGLVKNAKYSSIQEAPPRVFYIASVQYVRQDSQSFYVRTGLDPKLISNSIRATISSLDPNLPVRDLKTMQAQVDENLFAERLMALLTAGFAGLATLLAAIGLYGVLSFNIARRTREIGIRMALGATQGNVRKLVVREAGIMLGIGTIAGIGAAVGLGRFVDSLLFGMKPWDPYVYLSATVLLALVALLAAYVPVRRATKVDPMVALRYE